MGKVYLVGAGPGDPKLITLRALECIKEADVIAYDRLVGSKILDYAKESAEMIYCGKSPNNHAFIQDEINHLLLEKALQGKVVARLKGGDPCVFGRGGEEAAVLADHHIEYEIVPGITSGIAAPAFAGIPVTHRDYASSFAIVTGHGQAYKGQDNLNWGALAQAIDTIAFYMSVGNLEHICKQLIQHGKDSKTPVAIIQWGTTEKQKTITGNLENIMDQAEESNITHPAIILVGQVVSLREKLKWFGEQLDTQKQALT